MWTAVQNCVKNKVSINTKEPVTVEYIAVFKSYSFYICIYTTSPQTYVHYNQQLFHSMLICTNISVRQLAKCVFYICHNCI